MKKTRSVIIILVCLCLALSSGCGTDDKAERAVYAMDTVMTLTAYGSRAAAGLDAAEAVIKSLDAQLDPESPTSTVYALNNSGGESVVVSGQMAEMLSVAGTVYTRSGGALDLSVYPLVKLWGFIDGQYAVPSDEELEDTLTLVDFSKIGVAEFPDSDSALVTVPDGMALSFGSVAKGSAARYAAAAMKKAGVTSAIINLGGNVQTVGNKPDGSNWNVAVQDPNDTGSYIGILSVGETAVVTSGGYFRYFEGDDGNLYHHILDPETGYPAGKGLVSVTVICSDGLMADALSTALFVLGTDGAIQYYSAYGGFDMVLVTDDGRVLVTNGLYDVFTAQTDSYAVEYIGS